MTTIMGTIGTRCQQLADRESRCYFALIKEGKPTDVGKAVYTAADHFTPNNSQDIIFVAWPNTWRYNGPMGTAW